MLRQHLAVAFVIACSSASPVPDPPCRTPDITDDCWKSMGDSCTEGGGGGCLLCLAANVKKTAAAGCPQTPPGKVASCFCQAPGPSPSPPPSPGASCIPSTDSGLHKNVPCNLWSGLTFTYNIPAKCATSSCGLIVDVHGYDMDSEQENNNTAMRERGEENGYVVAQPSAPLRNWIVPGYPGVKAIYGFVDQALNAPGLTIDKSRVHLMGFSQGAFVTSGILCDSANAERFASFVVMEGPGFEACKQGEKQPPVLLQAGTNDNCCGGAKAETALEGLKKTWGLDTGTKVAGDGHFERTRYNSTNSVYPGSFEFLTYDYVADYFMTGHCFPGSDDLILVNPKAGPFPQAGPFGCPGNKERAKGARPGYVIGEEAMKWFLKYPKPETSMVV